MQRSENISSASLPYFPNLDGLRFIGFLIVFFSHGYIGTTGLFTEYNYQAAAGLDLFFVMSAFLITFRLIKEHELHGRIRLRKFVYRRSLRVWPLYFAVVFFGFGVHAILQSVGNDLESLPPLWTFLTFTMNFWIAQHGEAFLFFLVFLWSVCLEEQFYAILGLLIRYVYFLLVPVALVLIIGSVVFRFYHQTESLQLMYNSMSLMGSFGFGMLAAWVFYHYGHSLFNFLNKHQYIWPMVYSMFFASMFFYNQLYAETAWVYLDRLVIWVFMSLIILGQCAPHKQFLPMGQFASFRYLGKISYGLYVFHGIFILLFLNLPITFEPNGWYHLLFRPLLILGCTIMVSAISYRYFEKPFLQWKSKLSGL
ncbi:MAG: acyltransferase family protein [Bacteroidota bacterium]